MSTKYNPAIHHGQFAGEVEGNTAAVVPAKVTITAEPFTARRCPICHEWVYVDAGPFAEGDRTKTLADYNHWEANHATDEEKAATVIGFPYFFYNTEPVEVSL